MDPFEARLQFQQYLRTITSSNNNNALITNFILARQELQEDFHSCILEALDVNDWNQKLNIFQLVEVIIKRCIGISEKPFVRNLVRDLEIIIRKVCSSGEQQNSAINVNGCYSILTRICVSLDYKGLVLCQQRWREIGQSETKIDKVISQTETGQILDLVWEYLILIKTESKLQRINGQFSNWNLNPKLVLRRMEDDRERTKKSKETLWETGSDLYVEFTNCDSRYGKGHDDFRDMIELNGIVGQCYNDWAAVPPRN